jgi:hypothetical protein
VRQQRVSFRSGADETGEGDGRGAEGEGDEVEETQWLAGADPQPMLQFLRAGASGRKLRLFTCACARRLWSLLPAASRAAVEAAERLADAPSRPAACAAGRVRGAGYQQTVRLPLKALLSRKLTYFALSAAAGGLREAQDGVPAGPHRQAAERGSHCGLLRCIFGNPFRRVAVDPAWLTWNGGTVRQLAEAAYRERQLPEGSLDLGLLAVLADALEEAACGEQALPGHLRSPGPHVRGCWAVDLLTRRA